MPAPGLVDGHRHVPRWAAYTIGASGVIDSHVGRVDQEQGSHVLRERVLDGGLGIAEREPRGRIDVREHPHRFDAAQDHRHQKRFVEVARHRHPVARAGHPPQQRMVSVGRAVDREARVIGSPQLGGQRLGRLQVAARALQVVGATVQGQVEREQRVGETRARLCPGMVNARPGSARNRATASASGVSATGALYCVTTNRLPGEYAASQGREVEPA